MTAIKKNALALMNKTENISNPFLQKVTVNAARTHHDYPRFKISPAGRKLLVFFGKSLDPVFEIHQAHDTALPGDHVIAEIETQAEADQRKKIPAKHITVFKQPVHKLIESQTNH